MRRKCDGAKAYTMARAPLTRRLAPTIRNATNADRATSTKPSRNSRFVAVAASVTNQVRTLVITHQPLSPPKGQSLVFSPKGAPARAVAVYQPVCCTILTNAIWPIESPRYVNGTDSGHDQTRNSTAVTSAVAPPTTARSRSHRSHAGVDRCGGSSTRPTAGASAASSGSTIARRS